LILIAVPFYRIFNPIYGEYTNEIPDDFLVHHAYDDFNRLYSDNIAKEGEELLLKRSDVMFTTSKLLQKNYIQRFHQPEKVYFVPNGVDFTLFSKVNNKVIGINYENNRPIVGYTGSINAKIDISFLYQLFKSLSHCDFYVVGSEGIIDSFQNEDMAKLKALPNIYFFGNQKLADVPSYMNAMDINIIPYRTDPDSFPNAGYPLKLHEYLTVGKPIICSPIDSAFEFEDVIAIKGEIDEWKTEINELLSSKDTADNIQQRQDVAKNNTWKKKLESILNSISKQL
jgi:teichuronic acid biosynthesis glycosyltransferase TuaH